MGRTCVLTLGEDKWRSFPHILRVELLAFVDELYVGIGRKKNSRMTPR